MTLNFGNMFDISLGYTSPEESYAQGYNTGYTAGYTDGIAQLIWGNIEGTLSDQTDLQDALNSKQDALIFDLVPTEDSSNPVTSGGVYTAIANKASVTIRDWSVA